MTDAARDATDDPPPASGDLGMARAEEKNVGLEPEAPGAEPQSEFLRKFAARRERYQNRPLAYKAAVVATGFLVTVAGIVLSGPGIPGPGLIVIAIGLAMLALQFDWAARLLYRVVPWVEKQRRAARAAPTWQKVASVLVFVGGIAAYIVAANLWDIPVLPG